MGMKELYSSNEDFKSYVDKYCRTYRYTPEEALEHDLVNAVAHQYTHPDDTYTFGNVGPLRPLTNGDRIRAMSDEDLAEDRVECLNHFRSPYKGFVGDFDGVCNTREQAVAAEMEWMKADAV